MISRIRIIAFLLVSLVLGAALTAEAWSSVDFWTPPGQRVGQPAWSSLFDFDYGTTYRFDLSATRRNRTRAEGTLELKRWNRDELQFEYSIGRVSGRGTASADPQALVGALTISALSEGADWTTLQMILTPLRFVQWYDAFESARFRNGVVWQEMRNPPIRFEATRGRDGVYDGTVYVGRNAVLSLSIDPTKPLPTSASVNDGDLTYRATLGTALPPGLLR